MVNQYFSIGDTVSLKSSKSLKMTVIAVAEYSVTCSFENWSNDGNTLCLCREVFPIEALKKPNEGFKLYKLRADENSVLGYDVVCINLEEKLMANFSPDIISLQKCSESDLWFEESLIDVQKNYMYHSKIKLLNEFNEIHSSISEMTGATFFDVILNNKDDEITAVFNMSDGTYQELTIDPINTEYYPLIFESIRKIEHQVSQFYRN